MTDKSARAALLVPTAEAKNEENNNKYVCWGYYDKGKHEAMTEAEQNAMFDTCFEYDHLRANGHVAAEAVLQPPETALALYWTNGKVATTTGPYAETKEQLGGILVREARDMNRCGGVTGDQFKLLPHQVICITWATDPGTCQVQVRERTI